MNVDKDNQEPRTDLGLAVNYSNHCIQRRLNNHLGAGANAGSSRGMTFVTTDPLSELVWSPQKGPSLKCADCSFNDKKSSLLWGTEPTNVVFSSATPRIAAVRSSSDKPMNEDNNMIKPQMGFYVKGDIADRHTSARCPTNNAAITHVSGPSHKQKTGTGGHMEDTSTIVQSYRKHANKNDDLSRNKRKGTCDLNTIQVDEVAEATEGNFQNFLDVLRPSVARTEPLIENPVGGDSDVNSENQTSKMEIILMPDIHAKNKIEAYDDTSKSQPLPPKRHEEPTSFMEGENDRKIKPTDSSNVRPMKKLESTAENDLQIHIGENGCGAANKSLASEFAREGKRCTEQEEVIFQEKFAPGKYSATDSGIHKYERKAKGKALCDGDASMMSKEADDSYESVESCNSTGLFSTGKKRWNFEQPMIGGSKRAKVQIQETLESTSFVKQDSSFVNWISNMMKGFVKSKDDKAPSVSLTLAYPTNESPYHNTIATTRNQNPGSTVGFQSIFQSMYCSQRRTQDVTTSNDKCQKEVELPNGIFNPNPVNCHGENGNFSKQFTISNKKNTESTSENGVLLENQPKISSVNFAASQENKNTNSTEINWLCNLQTSKEKVGTSSSSSLSKCKQKVAEDIDSEPPSEGKAGQNFGNRSEHLGSLWIARLAPKTSGFSIKLNQQSLSTGVDLEDCTKVPPCQQYHVSSPSEAKIVEAGQHSIDDQKIAIGNNLLKCAGETEYKINCNKVKDHNDHKSSYKRNPILSSSRLKNSEAMASLFARRLDALKHIMPSDVVESTGSATVRCFFCGRKGHHLRDCSEMTDADLEDLLRTVNKYNDTEASSSFCVRCFQLNHWAVTCPNASSKGHCQRECGLAGDLSPSSGKHNSSIEENPKFFNGNESQFQAAGFHSLVDGNDSGIETNLQLNPTQKLVASNSGENKLKGSEIVPTCQYISRESLDVPKGIFDAVRMLRLSRTDILKWMNSQMSGSHLDGCFLRLRVGKREKGQGGTGYYVACITEAQRQSSPQNSKNSIFVAVRGIRCLVETQYISNHDFLEDELNAWWFTTKENEGMTPSEEALRLKVKERRKLGF